MRRWSFDGLPHTISSASPTLQALVSGFPSSMAILSTSITSIGNATIPLTMPSAIMMTSVASCSYPHGSPSAGSFSGVACDFCGPSLARQVSFPAAPMLTCPQLLLVVFFTSAHLALLLVTDASKLTRGSLHLTPSSKSFICSRPSSLT